MANDVIELLFVLFSRELDSRGIGTHKGTIVDATFVDASKQRNSREENKQVKNGEIPKERSVNRLFAYVSL